MATTGELVTIAEHTRAVYRLLGLASSDEALVEQGEAVDDIVYLCLTRGYRAAQRWLIDHGYNQAWRKRSAALAFSGSDAADGGTYVALPSDFLRLDGDTRGRSALVQANGDPWGCEVYPDDADAKGNGYYVQGGKLWLTRGAGPPSGLYLRYFYTHPAILSTTATFDMPADLRWLCVAEAADDGQREGWSLDGAGPRIESALVKARDEGLRIIRQTRGPRRFRGPVMLGTHF